MQFASVFAEMPPAHFMYALTQTSSCSKSLKSQAANVNDMSMGFASSAFPAAAAPIGEMIAQLTREAQGIPVVQHLAPRRTKPGAMPRAILIANVNAIEC